MPLTRETKEAVITDYAIKDGDTGSPEVQIALLTERIKDLTEHLRRFPKDQPLASRPPQARRAASSTPCVPDAQGQRALSRRHRTAGAAPLVGTPLGWDAAARTTLGSQP